MSRQTVVTIRYAALRCYRFGTSKMYSYDTVRKPGPWGGEHHTMIRRSGVIIPHAYREEGF